MAKKRRSKGDLKEIDVLVERLREFVRLDCMTAAEVARQIGVNDTTVYSWLLGQARPAEPKRIITFLDLLGEYHLEEEKIRGEFIAGLADESGLSGEAFLEEIQDAERSPNWILAHCAGRSCNDCESPNARRSSLHTRLRSP